ncbi:MAG TPA: radical SAM protein [Thermoanaerobaculaceae bacterium]|nr:radical SAM protein [Thermoanaerobaculaceae bacterium]HPS80088.1 radical SAM protein [Thermoanaerobaculaceae bacterium]
MRPILDLPRAKIAVELTSRCNLRCAMCPMSDLQRPQQDMPWELVEKVAADFRNNGATVNWLHEMGDPLLYPRLGEAIDLFPGCSVSTNALALTPKVGHELVDSSLGRIRLCVDTLLPGLYHQIRRGSRFDQVVTNIRQFLELARGSRMRIEVQRLITSETHHETVRDFARFFDLDRYPNAGVIEKTCEPLDTVDETEWHQAYYGCFQGYPFRWFIVLADGTVTHCCYDAQGQQLIGDLKTQTVQEIVHSERLADLAEAFRTRDWTRLPRCGECFRRPAAKPLIYDAMVLIGTHMERVIPLGPIKRWGRRLFNR